MTVIAAATFLTLLWTIGLMFVPGGLENEPYQLVLNSATSIVTFVMVFIIQSSQSRDNMAMQAKLDAQNQVLGALAQKFDADDPQKLLELMGVEDAPEKQIYLARHRVQQRG